MCLLVHLTLNLNQPIPTLEESTDSQMKYYIPDLIANEQNRCSKEGCNRNRRGFSAYCKTHSVYRYMYGHVDHKKIKRKSYIDHVKAARELIEHNEHTHRGIKITLQFLDGLLKNVHYVNNRFLKKYLLNLIDHNVTPKDILAECAGLFYCSCIYDKFFLSDTHMMYQIPNRVLRLGLVKGNIQATALKELGNIIKKNFFVMVVKLGRTLERQEHEKNQRLLDMTEELNIKL